jgi:hypothetical protein
MAVLTVWAGIQIAAKVQPAPVEPLPVIASGTPVPMPTLDAGAGGKGQGPASDASEEPDCTNPAAQPGVITLR